MSKIKIKGIDCHYILQGEGADIVLLHGWGQNTTMMQFIQDHCSNRYRTLNIDFPGFGESEEPQVAWSVEDYALFLEELFQQLNIKNPILIGHSFGCRVAFHYAAKHPVKKMILTGAAGLRPKKSLKNKVRVRTYKILKKGLEVVGAKQLQEKLKKSFGSTDYRNVSGVMRDTLVKVVNDDVSELLSKIDCPTFLFWGREDDATPLWMGQEIEKRMKNAGLAIIDHEGHYAYFNQQAIFCRALDSFLGGE